MQVLIQVLMQVRMAEGGACQTLAPAGPLWLMP